MGLVSSPWFVVSCSQLDSYQLLTCRIYNCQFNLNMVDRLILQVQVRDQSVVFSLRVRAPSCVFASVLLQCASFKVD